MRLFDSFAVLLGLPQALALASPQPEQELGLRRRAGPGAKCGSAAGNTVCDAGLCCSAAGTCGTGTAFCGAPDCQLSFGPACDGNQTPSGSDTSKIPRPTFGNVPYGVSISHCTVNGKVALTFDDGPYMYTTELLDLLKRNNVHATFFVVGNNAGKGHINDPRSGYAGIVQRMVADGHQVGSHTWSHQDLDAATPAQRRAQIINNEIAIADILGVIPTYLRPPYTRCGADCSNDLKSWGYHIVNYDIDTRDWQDGGSTAESTYKTILSQHSPASSAWIALAHDVQPQTVHTYAQFMIDTARALKYDLVTVGECLMDPPGNWYRNASTGLAQAASEVIGAKVGVGGGSAAQAGASTTTTTTTAAAAAAVPSRASVGGSTSSGKSGDGGNSSSSAATTTAGESVGSGSASSRAVTTSSSSGAAASSWSSTSVAATAGKSDASKNGGAGPRLAMLSVVLVAVLGGIGI